MPLPPDPLDAFYESKRQERVKLERIMYMMKTTEQRSIVRFLNNGVEPSTVIPASLIATMPSDACLDRVFKTFMHESAESTTCIPFYTNEQITAAILTVKGHDPNSIAFCKVAGGFQTDGNTPQDYKQLAALEGNRHLFYRPDESNRAAMTRQILMAITNAFEGQTPDPIELDNHFRSGNRVDFGELGDEDIDTPPARRSTNTANLQTTPVQKDTVPLDNATSQKSKAEQLIALLSGSSDLDESKVRDIAKNEFAKNTLQITQVITEARTSATRSINELGAALQADANKTKNDFVRQFEQLKAEVGIAPLKIITSTNAEPKNLGLAHKSTGELIQFLGAGCHVFLTGPAGSGKSTGAEQAAKALELPFYATSVCSQTTKTDFLGYMDATGSYRRTQFRDAYENGGVYLIDEIDAGNPNVLSVLNAALSNSNCAFPDSMVKRHDKFKCVAAGNTWGTGKTVQYVGRNAIDAATLNRFVIIHWDYDEKLEIAISGNPGWARYVIACRAEIKNRGIQFLITPRASINGAKAIAAKIPLATVLKSVLFQNLDPDVIRQMPKLDSKSVEVAP